MGLAHKLHVIGNLVSDDDTIAMIKNSEFNLIVKRPIIFFGKFCPALLFIYLPARFSQSAGSLKSF